MRMMERARKEAEELTPKFENVKEAYDVIIEAMNYLEDSNEDLMPGEDWDEDGTLVWGVSAQIIWDYKKKIWVVEEK